MPERPPDVSHALTTRPEATLIYRLSGDYNPVHVDPAVAKRAGFERPILHGLCTYGMIGRAIVATRCAGDPTRLKELGGRFSAVVYPGDTITVDVWDLGSGELRFRAWTVTREAIVFNNGRAVVT
jgi:acyl dehydratase